MKVQMPTRVEPQMHEEVREAAHQERISMNALVVRAIRAYLAKARSGG